MKNNNKIISVIIVLILILAGTLLYIQYNQESSEKEEKSEIQIIDDRISPFQGQKLTVELLRIRNRGLLDKMLKPGFGWREPENSFYWVTEVDGEVGDSSHILAAGGKEGDGTFKEWDTILKESRMNYKINVEDQIESKVRISIMEIEKSGLFGRNTKDVEKERIELTYDYRTGHWTGDDFILDHDGYGHYLGETYEVWFNVYQSDYDHDGIPFWTEVNIYGTDPTVDDSENDPDGDGIPSSWEWKWGYDPLRYDHHAALDPDVDGIENIEEYQMSKYFSDPYHQDMYLEADGMKKGYLLDLVDHVFYKESQQMIMERYAQHNINVYVDDGWPDTPVNGGGEMLDYVATLDEVVGGHMLRWYKHNFPDERKGIFRYVIVANNAGFITPSTYNNYDHIVVDNSMYRSIKRLAITPKLQRLMTAKAMLHELGHSLGLSPWTYYGIDITPGENVRYPNILTQEEYDSYGENYYSIMNYNYIWYNYMFDYSDGSRDPVYDFDDWGHAYLPSFQIDTEAVEEPIDETFEDFEIIDKEPEPVYRDWTYDENLTNKYLSEIKHYVVFDNAECDYRIYVNRDTGDVRGYVKPQVEPVLAIWSLVVEGKLNNDGTIDFYQFEDLSEKVDILLS